MMLRVTIVSQADGGGGAARAAFRLHRALRDIGHESRMRVDQRCTDDAQVDAPAGAAARLRSLLRARVDAAPLRLQHNSNPIHHSMAWVPTRVSAGLDASSADVLNLHWLGHGFMSVADIGRLRKPVVWTLHDSWAFCGAEHHPEGLDDERFVCGYEEGSRRPGDRGQDLDAWTWRRKRSAWKRKWPVVAPSRWLAENARRSRLMGDWPVHVIPNTLPVTVFRPWPRLLARELMQLPPNDPLVLFGALGGADQPGKGGDLLWEALRRLGEKRPGCRAVVVGQSTPARPPEVGMPLHYMGRLHDDAALAMLYAAADVVVIPSRLENLPQVGTEALACGTPVVAFDCSGLPDIVRHRHTGYLARAYDPVDLAEGISWVLEDRERHAMLADAARRHALAHWSPEVVLPRYLEVYQSAIEGAR